MKEDKHIKQQKIVQEIEKKNRGDSLNRQLWKKNKTGNLEPDNDIYVVNVPVPTNTLYGKPVIS